MQELAAVKYELKKSRFFVHLYLIEYPDEFHEIISLHQKKYKKAAHHCAAMNLRMADGKLFEEYKNDGEVGHPGRTLHNLLVTNGLESHAIIVSRVFGGIKLGPSGVTRAFRDSGDAAIKYYQETLK
ncbi:YigZ family protein [Methanoplanus sp. FWC-SCC4]|uniref:YigZ family protein n=1 Tax=Methanochimaera problematica TaxID=2609417 RepID=A0AA97FGJ2_9EURY|nr:YigZ family protein [Methanoplanus sp. FWC-SCC4]WOF17031.1 YigZ family protein [Methanoplanus sp. FWC-SCC4]